MSTPALPPELNPRGPVKPAKRGRSAAGAGEGAGRPPRPPGPGGPTGPGGAPAQSRARRYAMIATATLSGIVLAISVGGNALFSYYTGKSERVDVISGPSSSGGAQNFLLVGSDNRQGLTRAQVDALHIGAASANNGAGRRSDTMILLHLSANSDKATLISLPRDSYVTIPAYTDSKGVQHAQTKNKLNSAYEKGGPLLAVKTVELATGVHIDHYVEIGFEGFVNMVDSVGGVPVCSDVALKDPKSGLNIPAGTTTLDGTKALGYVRARYVDATSDLGRMKRQQAFLGSLFRQALSAGTLLDPLKLNNFLSATLSSVTLDSGLTRDDLLNLATRTKGLSPSNVVFLTVPLSSVDYRPSKAIGSTVLWSPSRAAALFAAIRDDKPIGGQSSTATGQQASTGTPVVVPPSHINVKVLNGSGVTGAGGRASNDLQAMGFVIAAPATNSTQHGVTRTTITYDPGWNTSVKTLQAAYPYALFTPVKGQGKVFIITLGTDYQKPKAVSVTASSGGASNATAPGGVKTTSAAQTVCKTS